MYIEGLVRIMAHEISGNTLLYCQKVILSIVKHAPRVGHGYLPPSPHLARRKGLLIPKVSKHCFYYACLIALYANEVALKAIGKTYTDARGAEKKLLKRLLERKCTWTPYFDNGVLVNGKNDYGDDLSLISEFESKNMVSVCIWSWSRKANQVVALRTTRVYADKHINLILLSRWHLPKSQQN